MKLLKMIITSSLIFLFSTAIYAEISVIKIQGKVSYKEGKNWLPLNEKQKLPEGVKISTGTNSYAEINLNSINHTVKIKPLTVIQIFSKETAENTDTHIGLKRGGITAKVPRDSKVKTIFKVSSPIATSSVRGTEEDISYGPDTGMTVKVLSGIIEGKNRIGRINFISGRQKFVQQFNTAKILDILNSVKNESLINVYGNGLTKDELATIKFFGDELIGNRDDDASGIINQNTSTGKARITFGN
jgi:hypothetical protein